MADLSEQQVIMADAVASSLKDADSQQAEEIRQQVNALLAEVSEDDRILLTLKEVEGLSLKELEKIYNIKENALKVRLYRARQRVLRVFERSKGSETGKSQTAGEET